MLAASSSQLRGVYGGTISFTAVGTFVPSGQWNPSADLQLGVEYAADNSVTVYPEAYFARVDAGTTSTQQVSLVNLGPDHLYHWWATVTNGGAWLSVSPSAGDDLPTWQDAGYSGSETNLTLTANAAGLSPGHYTCTLVITADNLQTNSFTSQVQLDVEQPVLLPTARLIGLEVNQVVQDWSNSVPLIAGKATTVRAHLQSLGTQPLRVTGQLHGFRNGSEILPPLDPKNPGGFILARTNAADLRAVLNNSLNFELPDSWTMGTVTLTFQSTNGVACTEPSGPNNCSATVAFLPSITPRIKFFGVTWVGTDGVTHSNSPALIADLAPRLVSCYPAAAVDSLTSEFIWEGDVPPDVSLVRDRMGWARLLDALPSLTTPDRIYYGAVAEGDIDLGGGIAFLPGDSSAGYLMPARFSPVRQRQSHEIGHNLGRHHATDISDFGTTVYTNGGQFLVYANGACDEKSATNAPTFPYMATINGNLRPALGPMSNGPNALVYGYDHDAGWIVSPYQCFDLMSYCRSSPYDRWPSKFTYEGLLTAISNRFANPLSPGPPAPGSFLFLRGSIDPFTDFVRFQPFATLFADRAPPPPPSGDYALLLLDTASQPIQQITFAPALVEPQDDAHPMMSFLIAAPANPAIHQVRVLHGAQMIGILTASVNPPTVRVLSPSGGESFTGDSISVRWTGSDPDGDPLTFTLQVQSRWRHDVGDIGRQPHLDELRRSSPTLTWHQYGPRARHR